MRGMMMCVLVLAACTPAGTIPAGEPVPAATAAVTASLAGTYALRQINGRPLPTASPAEPNVEISRGELRLGDDGAFAVSLTGRRTQDPAPEVKSMSGAYRMAGDTLVVSINGVPGPRFGVTRTEPDTLTLRDEQGNAFAFQLQP